MGFFEFITAISIVVILPLVVLKLILDYKRGQRAMSAEAVDRSIPLSDLKHLIGESVSEKTDEISRRLEWIEDRLEMQMQLNGAEGQRALSESVAAGKQPDPRSAI